MKLDQIIPDETVRKSIYVVFGVVGLALGVAQTAFTSLGQEQPSWLTVGFAVYAYLAAAGFVVSTANTPTATKAPSAIEDTPSLEEMQTIPIGAANETQEVATAGSDPVELAKHA